MTALKKLLLTMQIPQAGLAAELGISRAAMSQLANHGIFPVREGERIRTGIPVLLEKRGATPLMLKDLSHKKITGYAPTHPVTQNPQQRRIPCWLASKHYTRKPENTLTCFAIHWPMKSTPLRTYSYPRISGTSGKPCTRQPCMAA